MRNELLQSFASFVEEKQLGVHAAAVMQHGAFLGSTVWFPMSRTFCTRLPKAIRRWRSAC